MLMPELGESVAEGTITRWCKKLGEMISEDEPLLEVSTDKVDTRNPLSCRRYPRTNLRGGRRYCPRRTSIGRTTGGGSAPDPADLVEDYDAATDVSAESEDEDESTTTDLLTTSTATRDDAGASDTAEGNG